MSRLFEDSNPLVKEAGFATNKDVTLGGKLIGGKVAVVSGQGATATLTAAQTGSAVLFDRAAGIVYTLPAPAVGMYFDFITTVSITSNAAEVDTDSGSTFILGQVINAVAAGTNTIFYANGTSHVKISSNGTTSGGLKGGSFRMTAVSATVWEINGIVNGSGTIVTPFA